nr:MAG TPA_asm: hypothetical protein [Caudoviricetes sp.]
MLIERAIFLRMKFGINFAQGSKKSTFLFAISSNFTTFVMSNNNKHEL